MGELVEQNIWMLQETMTASCWQKLKSTVFLIQDEKKCQHEILEMKLGFIAERLCS